MSVPTQYVVWCKKVIFRICAWAADLESGVPDLDEYVNGRTTRLLASERRVAEVARRGISILLVVDFT